MTNEEAINTIRKALEYADKTCLCTYDRKCKKCNAVSSAFAALDSLVVKPGEPSAIDPYCVRENMRQKLHENKTTELNEDQGNLIPMRPWVPKAVETSEDALEFYCQLTDIAPTEDDAISALITARDERIRRECADKADKALASEGYEDYENSIREFVRAAIMGGKE